MLLLDCYEYILHEMNVITHATSVKCSDSFQVQTCTSHWNIWSSSWWPYSTLVRYDLKKLLGILCSIQNVFSFGKWHNWCPMLRWAMLLWPYQMWLARRALRLWLRVVWVLRFWLWRGRGWRRRRRQRQRYMDRSEVRYDLQHLIMISRPLGSEV